MDIIDHHNLKWSEYSNNLEKENILSKAKKTIEQRLTGMNERFSLLALQASLIGWPNGEYEEASICDDDAFTLWSLKEYYTLDGYTIQSKRKMQFSCFWFASTIEYKSHEKIDHHWNILPIYDRFSQYYAITIGKKTICFEHDEELINFLYHLHRLKLFIKNNPLSEYKQRLWDGFKLHITIPQKANWKLQVKKGGYYWEIPWIQTIWLKKDNTIQYRNNEEKEETSLTTGIGNDGQIDIQLETETIQYNQMYTIDFDRTTETKMPDDTEHSLSDTILTKIIIQELLPQ